MERRYRWMAMAFAYGEAAPAVTVLAVLLTTSGTFDGCRRNCSGIPRTGSEARANSAAVSCGVTDVTTYCWSRDRYRPP